MPSTCILSAIRNKEQTVIKQDLRTSRPAAPASLVRAEDAPIEIDLDTFFQVAADILDQSRTSNSNHETDAVAARKRTDLPFAE